MAPTPTRGYPRASETRIAAQADDVKADIERALSQAESHVARMPPSPTTRRLELTLKAHWRAVDSWNTRPPTGEQLRVVRERVQALLQLAKTTSPTVRLPRLG